jgi:hypothetical protein
LGYIKDLNIFFYSSFYFITFFFSFNFLNTLSFDFFNNFLNNFFFFNPNADLDVSTSTDCDDLIVFVSDIFEFTEQEQSLLFDSLTDLSTSAFFIGLGGLSTAISIRSLK